MASVKKDVEQEGQEMSNLQLLLDYLQLLHSLFTRFCVRQDR